MKIVYPVSSRFPTEKANGYQIAQMAKEFSLLGHSVTILSPYQAMPSRPEISEWYKAVTDSYKHLELGKYDFLYSFLWLGKLSFYLQQLYFSLQFFIYIRQHRDSVVLTRKPWLGFLASILHIPAFYECHDWLGKGARMQLWMCTFFTGIIVTNSYIYEAFVTAGFDKSRLLKAPNGVAKEIFDVEISKEEAIKRLPVSDSLKGVLQEKKVLLYTGSYKTMGVDKGIQDILSSMSKIGNEYVFVAVGGSEADISYYERLAASTGVADKVHLLGRFAQEELALFQKVAEVLLMPFPDKAHYRYHMSPLKTFEYLLSKRPIIASRLPSIEDIIPHDAAYWCDPDNPESLAKTITAICADYQKAQVVALRAYEIGKEKTWQQRASHITTFMQTQISAAKK
jgi:glycosyltransferase involved in cell wall biosynthesis